MKLNKDIALRRSAFKDLSFRLQLTAGENRDEIVSDMLEMMNNESDEWERGQMKRTIVQNADNQYGE